MQLRGGNNQSESADEEDELAREIMGVQRSDDGEEYEDMEEEEELEEDMDHSGLPDESQS